MKFATLLLILLGAGCATITDDQIKSDRALVKAMYRAAADAKGTPGEEASNLANDPARIKYGQMLRREIPATDEEMRIARLMTEDTRSASARGPDWPRPAEIRLPRASSPPEIDGKLNDRAWHDAYMAKGTYPFNKQEAVGHDFTDWDIMWDDTYIYFAFTCSDTDLVAPVYQRDEAVFSDDAVEMFILPEFETGLYWEIVVSPNGSIYDALNTKTWDQWGTEADTSATVDGMLVGRHIGGTINQRDDTDQGYTVEVAVPFDQLPGYAGRKPAAGQRLHLMLVRLDRNGDKHTPYAFEPLLSWGHNIWNHVPVILAE